MDNKELEKAKAHIIVEIIEYVPNSVVIKSIIKKTTGNISAVSFDTGEALAEKIIPSTHLFRLLTARLRFLSMEYPICSIPASL